MRDPPPGHEYEQHRHPLPLLQVLQEVEDHGLGRDIKRGCRLVGDQKWRVRSQGHCDQYALSLPA